MNIQKRELCCFLVVGCSSVLVDYLCYQILMRRLLWQQNAAKGISFLCGALFGFFLNKFWTFRSSQTVKSEIPRYALLYCCTAYINAQTNTFLCWMSQSEMLGFLGATGVSTVLNFMGQKCFVFARKKV